MPIPGREIDVVVYGNPTLLQTKALSTLFYLDSAYEPLQGYDFHRNSSIETQNELSDAAAKLRATAADPGKINYYRFINQDLKGFFQQNLTRNGIFYTDELIDEVFSDIENLGLKLKYFYNRPRPYQLAAYYKLALFPFTTEAIETPSYPSLHYLKAVSLCNIILKDVPRFSDYLMGLIAEVGKSRLDMGFCYKSDIDFSYNIFQKLLQHKGFTNKYEIVVAQ